MSDQDKVSFMLFVGLCALLIVAGTIGPLTTGSTCHRAFDRSHNAADTASVVRLTECKVEARQ